MSIIDLQDAQSKTRIVGSETMGGYIDGKSEDARFSFINDLSIQGMLTFTDLYARSGVENNIHLYATPKIVALP